MNILITLLFGAIAGWLAGFFVIKEKGGLIWNIIIGLLGAVLILGSIFLPYFSLFGRDINMLDAEPAFLMDDFADTWFFLGLAVLGGVFAVANLGVGQLLAGLACLGLWVYELVELIDANALDLVSIGFYGLGVGSLVLLIGGLVSMAKKKE